MKICKTDLKNAVFLMEKASMAMERSCTTSRERNIARRLNLLTKKLRRNNVTIF